MKPTFEPRAEALDDSGACWLSQGFEALVHALARHDAQATRQPYDFDVVIVGSGYGGALAAAQLAGCTLNGGAQARPVSVCVLERGAEYLAGEFPSRFAELAGHVRFSTASAGAPRGVREGLFDIRIGADVCALVANGLGGGSLINAGVMEAPLPGVFERGWPRGIDARTLAPYYKAARKLLGASDNRITAQRDGQGHPLAPPPKFEALKRLDAAHTRAVDLSVALNGGTNVWRVTREACLRCGDCATGCNHGAKDSLDVGPLAYARRRGAHIYTGATVLRVRALPDAPHGWQVVVTYTHEKLRRRQGAPLALRARRVILAAGTFGSTEILLRSAADGLALSPAVGQRFSTNGDAIATVFRTQAIVNAAAEETLPPGERDVGPTITAMIDRRGDPRWKLAVQELAVPAPLRRLMEEVVTTAASLHDLPAADPAEHEAGPVARDPFAIDHAAIDHSLVVAMFGDDGAAGALELTGDARNDAHGDGAIRVRWPQLRRDGLFARQLEALREWSRGHVQPGAHVLPNPLWRPLPDDMIELIGGDGPLLTVHPLGGCAMADRPADGVVDACGRVFRGDGNGAYEGLVVLDGAIVPTALGINPSLTIAALALRALRRLRREWGLRPAPARRDGSTLTRPRFRVPPVVGAPIPTEVEVVERMHGEVVVVDRAGARKPLQAEVTFRFGPVPLRSLAPGVLPLAEGWLRFYDRERYKALDRRAGDHARRRQAPPVLELALRGKLHLFEREASTVAQRRRRARCAYLRNRGLRDAWDAFVNFVYRLRRDGFTGSGNAFERIRATIERIDALATRAGEVRTLRYDLTVTDPQATEGSGLPRIERLTLRKRLTYAHAANPWQQLMQAELWMDGLAPECGTPVLELDPEYFASEEAAAPLVRIVRQQDQPSALADLASFALYVARMVATIHFWAFRKPDAPSAAPPDLLPGPITRFAAPPEIVEPEVHRLADGTPVRIRLTRYRGRSEAQPVLLIHGYSASGTTFTHPAVRPNLARYLWDLGFDVWVVDLRTSASLPSSRLPWSFEDVARADIPAAIDHVWLSTAKPVDVVAHCMGAAMFGMAVLEPPAAGDRYFLERAELPQRVRRAVLSQIGPALQLSPANTFRGFVMRYLRHLLPVTDYEFRPPPGAGLADALLDRLLASLPYPRVEWDIANPPFAFWRRTPWLTTRLRMDALFGRVFNLENMPRAVLAHIDDLFGRINLETAAQPIQFAQWREITLRDGRRTFLQGNVVRARWTFPTLSLHSERNGLADFATIERMRDFVRLLDPRTPFEAVPLPGVGHQDTLIGTAAARMPCFDRIAAFLAR